LGGDFRRLIAKAVLGFLVEGDKLLEISGRIFRHPQFFWNLVIFGIIDHVI